MSIHIAVRDLPRALQAALSSVGYGRKDIRVEHRERESIADAGGNGYQGFAIVVNLSTGARETHVGSWGGPNMFAQSARNRVDSDHTMHTIPPDGAVIRGSRGGGKPVYATITVSPACQILALPPAAELTDRQRAILSVVCGIRGGYRREYFERGNVQPSEIDALVTAGLVTRNRAGALSATTAGRNACGNADPPYRNWPAA